MFALDNVIRYFYETLGWLQKHTKIVPTQFYNNTSEFSLYNLNCDFLKQPSKTLTVSGAKCV